MAGVASLITGKSKTPAPVAPTPQPTVRMPDKQDANVLEAQRRRRDALSNSGGRSSTILTDDTSIVPSYSNSELGQ